MNKKATSLLTFVLASLLPLGASAQTKVVFAPQKTGSTNPSSSTPLRAGAKAGLHSATQASEYKSPLPLAALSDRDVFSSFVAATGSKPSLVQKVQPTKSAKRNADAEKTWNYTGFNMQAGTAADGSATGGLVDFNLQPFECDTVSSDNGVSPYSYMAKGKLYCFLPHMDMSTGNYTSVTRTTYDANTLERLEQKDFSLPGSRDKVPYLISYDSQRDVVYAISMLSNPPEDYGVGEGYYLNVLDTATCKLQRIGYLGGYSFDRKKGNLSPKAFVTTTSGQLFLQNSDDSIYINEIDPATCEMKVIGRTDIPQQYTYGLQPMIYDGNSGNLLINHYDFTNGTQYYKVAPYLAYGQKDNVLKTELVENVPTGFTYIYRRPESETQYFKFQLADISDLKADVDDNGKATISFTIPDTDDKGNKIEIPSWSYNTARVYVYIDNQYTNVEGMPTQAKLGDKLTLSADVAGTGMHIITVNVSPMYNETKGVKNSVIITNGYDAPAMVGNPSLSIENDKAVITWTAPTEGRYADFGSKFDPSDLTYKVVRNSDGKVIADGTTELKAEDTDLADEIQTYSYTIYATSHGQTGLGIRTNGVSAGKYVSVPYENNFDNSGCLDGYTVLNLDNNGTSRTWNWNSYYNLLVSGWGMADDWLISPKFKLSSDNVYALRYDIQGSGSLRTTIGKGDTPDDQNENILDDIDNYQTPGDAYQTREFYFHPEDDDTYSFGLYNYSLSDNSSWYVNSISLKPVAKTSAPDMVRSLKLTPDDGGALGATISFAVPATAINGNKLSSVSKVTVYDLAGNVLGTAENVAPGSNATVKVQAVHGWNDFKVVAANDEGEGWPTIIRKFIGLDMPKPVGNLTVAWGDDRTVANLSWEAPTEGVNGGYVDPAAYTYKIYKYDSTQNPQYQELGSTEDETSIEVNILDATEKQDQYVFGVTAVNQEGESDYSRAGIVLGLPYTLPFDEPFAAKGVNHAPWLINAGKNNQAWTIDAGHYNANIQPENEDGIQLVFFNSGNADGSSSFMTPIIDFTDAKQPVFSVWLHHSDAMPEGAYVNVLATTDGSKNFTEIAPKQTLTGNNGWTEHIFDLSALNGKKAQVALNAYLPNPSFRIFADNWSIHEAEGNDLALAAISQPYMPKVGDQADIAVTVTNKGAKTADNYSVLFNLNGETIAEKESEKALAIGESATFHFPLAVSAAQKDIVYSAEVMYDDDDNEDNNYSTEVELSPEQISLPAPTDLAFEGSDNTIAWTAPETMDGREVTLDFEDQPAFKTDSIKGWTTVDLDKTLTIGFVQYYGNYWPYLNQQLAWMTWSALDAGCPDAEMWKAHSGDKCIIAWGNYGADATGRTNNDPVNDWFISPEVKGGTNFSFYTLSNDATSTLEIRTSSTDNKPESFDNLVKTVSFSNISEWYEVEAQLPDDAKYVAIRANNNGFGILVDDIKYTEAHAPQLKGYNIYNGTELAATATETSAKAGSNGTYAVSAVYDLGESPLSNTVAVTTGINEIGASDANVTGGNGTIYVNGADGNSITVYSAAGQKVAFVVAANNTTFDVTAGVYIVKVGQKAYKVSVK